MEASTGEKETELVALYRSPTDKLTAMHHVSDASCIASPLVNLGNAVLSVFDVERGR